MNMNKIITLILALLPLGLQAQPLDTNLDEYLQPLIDRIEALEDRVTELEAQPPVVVEPGPPVVVPEPDVEPSSDWLTPEAPEDSLYLPEDATAEDLTKALSSGSSVYLPAGSVFEVDNLWVTSGGSEDSPRVLGTYGDGPRPMIRVRGSPALGISQGVENLVVSGWELYRPTNNPDDDLWDPKDAQGYGILAYGDVSHVLVEDCRVSFFGQGMVFHDPEDARVHDITLHRNIVLYCWKRNDRGEGVYTNRVRNLTVTENVFAHNGWHPSVSGRVPSALHLRGLEAHGCYFSGRYNSGVPKKWPEADKGPEFVVQFHGNAVLDSSANGAQFRLGGVVHDNVFTGNPMALYTWTNPSDVRRNAITDGTHVEYSEEFYQRGWGMQVIASGEYTDNVIARVRQRAAGSHALVYEHGGAEVHDNVFYDWGSNKDRPDGPVWNKNNSDPSGFSNNLMTSDPSTFVDASREVTEAHRTYWTERPRGSWDPSRSPSTVSAWIRAGFEVSP